MWTDYGRFVYRHLGSSAKSRDEMLERIDAASLDQLIDETIPASIRLKRPLASPAEPTEAALLDRLAHIAGENRICRSYIGLGYYETTTPSVILRNVLENPSWYTPYTPYQAEIAQGRLEALLNYQTMVTDLTGMDVANASLLDEATAAAEAMTMMHRIQHRGRREADTHRFLVAADCFPQTVEVLRGRAEPLGIDLVVADVDEFDVEDVNVFGMYVQTPNRYGALHHYEDFIAQAHGHSILVGVGTDLLSLALLDPPGEWGADVVVGSAQRFGVPMGYGGPHAAFFATRHAFVREAPGRIIGVSHDANGRPAYRMALQTREQHIRREKAKSNICTAQALLANMAGFYAVYHGPEGLRSIAERIHRMAALVHRGVVEAGLEQVNASFFDTLHVRHPDPDAVRRRAEAAGVNFHYGPDGIGIALGEPVTVEDVQHILTLLVGTSAPVDENNAQYMLPPRLRRKTPYLEHSVFHCYRSETEMMRYLKRLAQRDIGLDTSMIPLGSCTMKLNAATEMMPVTWPAFSSLHPFAPLDQAAGYRRIRDELEQALSEITGFPAVSLQPNSGAQGEYAGLMVIRAYHRDRGDAQRDVVLIPSSAHGTNPASAVMAGMRVMVVQCDDQGNVDVGDLTEKANRHRSELAGLMVTYPSTHGVFEEQIQEICTLIHERGGLVYMDGANLNAQVGLTSPASIGADVCHLNLHKTFSIPHGGGGPGMGPIAVTAALAPYLPGHPLAPVGGERGQRAMSAAPWGSASILLISYAYIRLLGGEGMTEASRVAILNANYIKVRLQDHYHVLFSGRNGRVAHELIFDLREFKHSAGITETDVAKRLMDYGFHAPTVSWPVPGTMMIEPTESESKAELDRFCDALIAIRGEIAAIEHGEAEEGNNVLVHAPHTAGVVCADRWDRPYSREQAAFPLPWVREAKVWPAVGRIDNTAGDRNLICSCPGVEAYVAEPEPVLSGS